MEAEQILKRIGYDNNSITATEKWIAKEVYKLAMEDAVALSQPLVRDSLPRNCVDPLYEIKGCDMPKGSCSDCASIVIIDDEKDKHEYETWDNGAPCYVCPKCKESDIGHGDNNCSSCGVKLEWHNH